MHRGSTTVRTWSSPKGKLKFSIFMLRAPAEARTTDLLWLPKAAGAGAKKAWDRAREPSVSMAKVFIIAWWWWREGREGKGPARSMCGGGEERKGE